ncbi:hypothetical protein [Nocardioides euryhalodurans]|uniref:Uncharacterized protein n=1 Tax=Nocardioides euryhalodurans TaxID=2518370 RepID=A0A4P7GLD0_9ACTN|nr:hypothetical protein [Nocardioides euryhalodurans]QBR92938.1 hypothetical protein EXE57_12150 [Nocardioides euryhalodurans]
MPWNELSQTVRLLALLGRVRPEVFDAFPPHGPVLRDRFEAVGLNPQPLPPRDPLVVGAVTMAGRVATLAVEADVRGEEPARWVRDFVADWCETPWPRRWPWPGPGPGPDGPQPDPWSVNAARVAGASVLASVAAGLGAGELRDALAHGAEQLADVAGREL